MLALSMRSLALFIVEAVETGRVTHTIMVERHISGVNNQQHILKLTVIRTQFF